MHPVSFQAKLPGVTRRGSVLLELQFPLTIFARSITFSAYSEETEMVERDKPEKQESLVKDLQRWLAQELMDIAKARQLRIKEATGIVDSVLKGTITADEGFDLTNEYEDRWGEALPGALALPGLTDEQIIARIDQAHRDDDARMEGIRRRAKTRPPPDSTGRKR
jgi:hypothetical protein